MSCKEIQNNQKEKSFGFQSLQQSFANKQMKNQQKKSLLKVN